MGNIDIKINSTLAELKKEITNTASSLSTGNAAQSSSAKQQQKSLISSHITLAKSDIETLKSSKSVTEYIKQSMEKISQSISEAKTNALSYASSTDVSSKKMISTLFYNRIQNIDTMSDTSIFNGKKVIAQDYSHTLNITNIGSAFKSDSAIPYNNPFGYVNNSIYGDMQISAKKSADNKPVSVSYQYMTKTLSVKRLDGSGIVENIQLPTTGKSANLSFSKIGVDISIPNLSKFTTNKNFNNKQQTAAVRSNTDSCTLGLMSNISISKINSPDNQSIDSQFSAKDGISISGAFDNATVTMGKLKATGVNFTTTNGSKTISLTSDDKLHSLDLSYNWLTTSTYTQNASKYNKSDVSIGMRVDIQLPSAAIDIKSVTNVKAGSVTNMKLSNISGAMPADNNLLPSSTSIRFTQSSMAGGLAGDAIVNIGVYSGKVSLANSGDKTVVLSSNTNDVKISLSFAYSKNPTANINDNYSGSANCTVNLNSTGNHSVYVSKIPLQELQYTAAYTRGSVNPVSHNLFTSEKKLEDVQLSFNAINTDNLGLRNISLDDSSVGSKLENAIKLLNQEMLKVDIATKALDDVQKSREQNIIDCESAISAFDNNDVATLTTLLATYNAKEQMIISIIGSNIQNASQYNSLVR